MRTAYEVTGELVGRLRELGYTQVDGYNRFGFIRTTDRAVYVTREKGEDTPIPFARIEKAINAVRQDPTVYSDGPGRLREFGITHVNSPIWSMLHLLPIDRILR